MPELDCPHCGKTLRVPDTAAGKRVRCPGCKEPFAVPSDDPDESAGAAQEDPEPPRPVRRPRAEEKGRPGRAAPRDADERPRRPRPRSRDDEDDEEEERPRRRRARAAGGGGEGWRLGWSPFIGITYGPIPVGLIFGLCVLAVAACLGVLNAE